jgi:hypothetical protein
MRWGVSILIFHAGSPSRKDQEYEDLWDPRLRVPLPGVEVGDDVGAGAALEPVGPKPPGHGVVVALPDERIVSSIAEQLIAPVPAS